MDVIGTEIGQKMRSAIKAKLTELGCYVDDELPDYVMVMVANKRTRLQMEDDLQLFLGDNTELFVNWLHQVLKKLQEVTVTTPLKPEVEKHKEKPAKEKKSKDKKQKDKVKKTDLKKAKKKDKDKEKLRKKEEKKVHKSKKEKKNKHSEMIRPNVPPLLMNMEKESEPSITDVFAGQILKNHGVILETKADEPKIEEKPVLNEKRPILPIIDPATITSQPESTEPSESVDENLESVSSAEVPREEQMKEINEIEAKILGLKQKLAEQLDSMSDDEDFLTIRTEAEELMNDFAEDVFQEISQQTAVSTPPLRQKTPSPPPPPKIQEAPKTPKETRETIEPETLPQIELNLPKRPIRERLGAKDDSKPSKETKSAVSPERFTPEKEPEFRPQKSAKSRLGVALEPAKKLATSDQSSNSSDSRSDISSKKVTSKVSVKDSRARPACASVVRVRPRPRVNAPNLLLKAVADAHKSLLNIPPKSDGEPQKVKRALVLPMRRCVDAQNIVIQVPTDRRSDTKAVDSDGDGKCSKTASDYDKDEYIPTPITKKFTNTEYVPSRRPERTSSRRDDTLIIETINIHNTTVDKEKGPQFIVTMDGFNPNAFLAKKLMTEGLLDDEATTETPKPTDKTKTPEKQKPNDTDTQTDTQEQAEKVTERKEEKSVEIEKKVEEQFTKSIMLERKRLSDTSEESDTQVIIKTEDERTEKRKSAEVAEESPPQKKRRASPIVFDVDKKKEEKPEKRERTESASSDNHVTISTTINSHKYDSLPPLSAAAAAAAAADRKVWCRAFPACRYGSACAFQHPRCKFAAACTRRGCVYSHARNAPAAPPSSPSPAIQSHVVPAANYKSISAAPSTALCKFYPACANAACPFYHPRACRYGKACANKLQCNFYHSDSTKWRYPV